jgi:hypothetical protein
MMVEIPLKVTATFDEDEARLLIDLINGMVFTSTETDEKARAIRARLQLRYKVALQDVEAVLAKNFGGGVITL